MWPSEYVHACNCIACVPLRGLPVSSHSALRPHVFNARGFKLLLHIHARFNQDKTPIDQTFLI